MNKKNSIFSIIKIISTSFLLALLLTIIIGYVCGFRAFIVNGWSSEPDIPYHSVIVDYKVSFDDIHVGDYITFSNNGAYTTHVVVAKCGEGDYADKTSFHYGEEIVFENMGITFSRTCTKDGSTIVTMTNNYNSYADLIKEYQEGGTKAGQTCSNEGPSAEFNSINSVSGKVINILPKTGQFLIYIKNNFSQVIFYAIILYIGADLLRFVPNYIKLF